MNIFKNIYIILLCICMPFIAGFANETYGKLSIGYGILAATFLIYSTIKKNQSNPILEKLNNKLDEVDEYLDNGKGIIELSNEYEQAEGIPPVLTIKSILYTMHEACKKDVLQYTHALDRKAPNDLGVIKLLDKLLVDFDTSKLTNIKEEIKLLDEFRNVLYVQENISYKIQKEGEEDKKGFGVLILTLNVLLFVPMKWEFFKNFDKNKLFDLLNQVTSSLPYVNVGLATSELLLAFHENTKPEEVYFNTERKQQLEDNFDENNGWYLAYSEMDEFIFPYRMKGLKGVDQSLSIKTDKGLYKLWQVEQSEEFRIELLEQLLTTNLLHRQVYYHFYEKYEGRSCRCKLVPSSDIDYKDPRMIAFREQEIKKQR